MPNLALSCFENHQVFGITKTLSFWNSNKNFHSAKENRKRIEKLVEMPHMLISEGQTENEVLRLRGSDFLITT